MTLRPNDYDRNGDIIPSGWKEEKGDLISRSALKEEFLKYKPYAVDFLSLINNAPTVEAFTENDKALAYCEGYVRGSHEAYIRPQGEWKGDGFVFCNQCGCSHGTHKTNFCPNCGADMRKGGA